MEAKKQNIIYCYPKSSSFIVKDINLLSNSFTVLKNVYNWEKKKLLPFNLIKQFTFFLFTLKKSEGVIVMFAGYWSVVPVFMANLYSKQSYVILGGTDCVSYPELNYGSLRKKWLKLAIGYSVRKCSKLLPVAEELMKHENSYYDTAFQNQGLKSFFPKLKTPYKEIANGYEFKGPWDNCLDRKQKSFISVAFVNDDTRYILKGFDKIRELALKFPANNYTLVGVGKDIVSKYFTLLPNVTCYGSLNSMAVQGLLISHEFYLQLSISEGHPNALCEAMVNGCIPIGSNVTSISRIIGESGFIIKKREGKDLFDLFEEISNLSEFSKLELSNKAHYRIVENFGIKKREELLKALF